MPLLSKSNVGYPEIKYWTDEYLCKKISDSNKDALCNVVFFKDKTNKTANFEYLFNTSFVNSSSGSDIYEDPLPSSLFNVQTLKQLILAGEGSINIIENKTISYGVAISK